MSFLFSPLLLGALLSILGVVALRPEISGVDKDVVARKGSTVTLSCPAWWVNRRKTLYSWEFEGKEITSSNRVKIPKPHYKIRGRGIFSLNIKNVSDDDVGTYTCKVYNLYWRKPLEAKENIELSLLEEVLNVTSTQTNITLDEGSTTTLHCRVIFLKAFTTDVYWLFNEKIVTKSEALHHKVNGVSLTNEVKRLNYSLELKHVTLAQSGIYTCSANSTIGLQTHDVAVSVNRAHGPYLLLIEKTKPSVKITNGTNVTLSCLGIYPAASFDDAFWLFNGSQIKSNKYFEVNNGFVEKKEENIKRKLLSLTIYNAQLEDSGNYSCVLNTSHGLRRKHIKVNVTFSRGVVALRPEISGVDKDVVARKGSTVTLSCPATRVNRRKTLFYWEFNGKEIRRSNRVKIPRPHYQRAERRGIFSLNIKNVSDDDVGTYTCKVNNIYGGKILEAKENILLSLLEEVLNVTSTQTNITLDEGSTTTLHCRVIFSENFTTEVYWLFNGKIITKPEALRHKVNGVSLANKVKRLSYSLELKRVTLAQSGIYTCGVNSTIALRTHDIAVSVHRTQGPDLTS